MNQYNFIEAINLAHLDNARRSFFYVRNDKEHVASSATRTSTENSVSPVTNFIFEFFIYNSIYSVDWQSSIHEENVTHHNSSIKHGHKDWLSEGQQQARLETFLKEQCLNRPELLISAFTPLVHLNLHGDWTKITPDDRVSLEDGERFFRKINEIAELVKRAELRPSPSHFKLIKDCRRFCYLVRNNIFHGSKSLGQLSDKDQQQRIEVYNLFLRSLNSLFFTAMGRKAASGIRPSVMIQRIARGDRSIRPDELRGVFTTATDLARSAGLMKQLPPEVGFNSLDDKESTAMFYPSAGFDFLLPLLVGMPRCTDFYFYDIHQYCPRDDRFGRRNFRSEIEPILRRLDEDSTDEINENATVYSFSVDGIPRKVWLIHDDNLDFLNRDVALTCFFHRGDSWGEGGSGQAWDSDLLPQLMKKACPKRGCLLFTDGQPGGIAESTKQQLTAIDRPTSKGRNPYYTGILREDDCKKH